MSFADFVVLIVDDSPTMRFFTKGALRDLGIREIVEADDGREAISYLSSMKVDAVIADWNMPGMSGLELLKWVRANGEFNHMPFLMVTAKSQPECVMEAMKARVSDYILKPFAPALLTEKLRKILGSS